MSLIGILTASFIPFFVIAFLIIIHELGHFLTAKMLGIEVDKIVIYPLGGISKFRMPLNTSINKEFLILIMGPLFQQFAYIFLKQILTNYISIVKGYHYGILLFNLLPIYPLDGGKLLNLFLAKQLSFKRSLKLTLFISYIAIVLLLFINFQNVGLNLMAITIFLLWKTTKEYQQINYLYNKFLLERYLNNYHFKNCKMINDISKFYRDRRHIIKEKGKYYLEKDSLEKIYKNINKKH